MIGVNRTFYNHVGIYVGRQPFGGEVLHNDKVGGVILSSLAEFSNGKFIYLHKKGPDDYFAQVTVVSRALSLLGRKFDLLTFNCEHAANFAQAGETKSPQLQLAGLCLFAICGLAILCGKD